MIRGFLFDERRCVMSQYYEELIQSLQEVLDDVQSGGQKLKRRVVTIEPVKEYKSEEINNIRNNNGDEVKTMCEVVNRIMKMGNNEGKEEERIRIVQKKQEKGMSAEEIAELLELPKAEIEDLIETIQMNSKK